MKRIKELLSNFNIIISFLLGVIVAGGFMFFYLNELSRANYYRLKDNLTLAATAKNYLEVAIVQDSLITLDSHLMQPDIDPLERMTGLVKRLELIDYYGKLLQKNDLEVLTIRLGGHKLLQDHYYEKYLRVFDMLGQNGQSGINDGDFVAKPIEP